MGLTTGEWSETLSVAVILLGCTLCNKVKFLYGTKTKPLPFLTSDYHKLFSHVLHCASIHGLHFLAMSIIKNIPVQDEIGGV